MHLLGVRLERLELVIPHRLDILHPRPEPGERLGPELDDPGTGILLQDLLGDESRAPENPEVAAHRRPAHRQRLGHLTRALGLASQALDDGSAGRVGQRRQRAVQLSGHEVWLP